MRKFNLDADIIFSNLYSYNAKYQTLPCRIESLSHFCAHEKYSAERDELSCFIILYTIEGEGVLYFEGETHKMAKNQVMFIDCSKHHIYKSAEGKDWDFYFMLIEGDAVRAYYDILFHDKYYILDYFDNNVINKFVDTMLYLVNKPSQPFELLACHLINDLIIQIMLLNANTSSYAFIKTIEYIEENFEKKITIDELADIAKMSKYHFIRKFKRTYSETPYEFITRFKINKSKSLLLTSEHSIDEISLMVGFNDATTFIRAFKKLTGITPNKYRTENKLAGTQIKQSSFT